MESVKNLPGSEAFALSIVCASGKVRVTYLGPLKLKRGFSVQDSLPADHHHQQ